MLTRRPRSYAFDDEIAERDLLGAIEKSFYLDDAESILSEDEGASRNEDLLTDINEDSIAVSPSWKQLVVKLRMSDRPFTPKGSPSSGQVKLSE